MKNLSLAQIRRLETRPVELGVDNVLPLSFEPRPAAPSGVGTPSIRWKDGERLHHLLEQACARFDGHAAIDTGDRVYSYRQLDTRANQTARYLLEHGVKSGDRVALMFDKSVDVYVAMLAVLKLNAAYVPLDPGFPAERIRFIAGDAGLTVIVSVSEFADKLGDTGLRAICLDSVAKAIDGKSAARLTDEQVGPPRDQVCYIIYTSGTTGHPKGVVIEHPSICNFVRVASAEYGYRADDRVYQGMTIAFDFSVEEIWVPLMVGATLVPAQAGTTLMGEELADFLDRRAVTCMACCPTLLATIERDLPALRLLLVGGEACPRNLVVRWHSAGRTILNSYGPTEATVTATLTQLLPSKPVTIGRPLPTYSVVILDPAAARIVAPGERGEIGIAGIGLAKGYLNLDELTQKKFIADFLGLPDNPSRRIYRTGDLGRVNDDGDIEYLGRIDTQVKIRGHRIELGEIESVLLELPHVAQAAVATYQPEPGQVELVGYYARKQGAPASLRNDIMQTLRARLPAYMVPAFLEELPFIPMLISNKADHKRLPRPKGPRAQSGNAVVMPRTTTERILAGVLADILKVEQVSVEDHFFTELSANSLLMAKFCAVIRQNPALSALSMRDIYMHPTVRRLAEHLAHAPSEVVASGSAEPVHIPSQRDYYICGALQLSFFAAASLIGLWLLTVGFFWISEVVDNPVALYLRGVAMAVAGFFGLSLFSIAAKWILIGRWKEDAIPIWSLRYFRFWVVKTLTENAPAGAFLGTPIYNFYLRLLGARIGRNVVINTRHTPVCTDLFSIGDNSVLSKDSVVMSYRAQSNFIHTGRIDIGCNAFVGEASVLDIRTAMGDRTQLAHASSLQTGQRIGDGKRYHGSPAVATDTDFALIDNAEVSTARRTAFVLTQLLWLLGVSLPMLNMVGIYAYRLVGEPAWETLLPNQASIVTALLSTLPLSLALFFGTIVLGLAGVYAIPRLCQLFLKPDTTYKLYGFHHFLQNLIAAESNSKFYNLLFGDSSAIVGYLKFVGWKLGTVEQTGSNFGTNTKHDNPFLCEIGSGTMVSDGLSMMNVTMGSSAFRLSPTRIGERNYLGNNIHYPPRGRTGANCLLGTKVMIPIDGPVRENVGLLGSPCFEIPRMVERDQKFMAGFDGATKQARLGRKNAYNLATVLMFLATRWAFFFFALFVFQVAFLGHEEFGLSSLFAAATIVSGGAIGYFALIERATLGFKCLEPKMASIYDPYFWFHERHWKLSDSPIVSICNGTPIKNLISRMIGLKIGKMVYDDGCSVSDRSLTEIGDYANLNAGSVLQAHSLEEGVFKSDFVRIGEGSTLGPGAFVHYGVVTGDNVIIAADSFVMKGEALPAQSQWCGNPAKMIGRRDAQKLPRDQFIPLIAAE